MGTAPECGFHAENLPDGKDRLVCKYQPSGLTLSVDRYDSFDRAAKNEVDVMKLTGLSVKDYVQRVADGSPTPGGGSVCALACSLSAALCLMVAHLTLGKKKYRKVWAEMQQLDRAVGDLVSRLFELTEQDAEAYDGVLSAFRLVQASEAQKEARRESIEAALKRAAIIPMETLRTIVKLTDFVEEAIEKGNPNCLCDAAVAYPS